MTSSLNQNACPPLDYYMADRIYNKHDLEMWRIATEDVNYFCPPTTPPPPTPTAAIILQCEASGSSDANCKSASIAKMAARIAAEAGDRNTNDSLGCPDSSGQPYGRDAGATQYCSGLAGLSGFGERA